jgi:integrase
MPDPEGLVFADATGKMLSTAAMSTLFRTRMGFAQFSVHGFRSTFRDWAGEATTFPESVAEAALSHLVGTEVERAYKRGDVLEKRRKLMEAWASYCDRPKAGNVVPMRRA